MKKLFLVLSILFFSQFLAANTNRFFNRITVNEGLASNNVYAIWQDKKGYIWVGNSNGLQRFDGKYFLYFDIKKPKPLPAQPVRQIMEDLQGNMWIRYGDEYGIYNPAELSFTRIPFENDENRFLGEQLWMDNKGDIYIILKRNKLLYYDKQKGIFSDKNLPIQLPDGYHPNAIFEDSKTGYYWISCQEGLAVYDAKLNKVYSKAENPLKLPYLDNPDILVVTGYFIDSKRNHWIHYWNPISAQYFNMYNETTASYTPSANSLFNNTQDYRELHEAFESKTGSLWYYGLYGLFVFDPEMDNFELIRNVFFKYGQIYQIYEDREGGIWLASDEGIYHYTDNSPAVTYGFYKNGEPKHLFIDIKEIQLSSKPEPQFWVPSWGRGIMILDESFKEFPSSKIYRKIGNMPENFQPWALVQERESQMVWVGAQSGWLQIIEPNSLEANFYNFPVFKKSTIRSISQDKFGNIWFTTQRGDLIKYHAGQPLTDDSFELVQSFNGLALGHLDEFNNKIWVGTSSSGVYCVETETGEISLHLDASILSSNRQEEIAQLNDSIYFFGYDLLNVYNANSNENKILSYTEGLMSNDILKMQVDQDGFLWIKTTNGICRYNYFQNSFTHYGQKDGFGLLEFDGDGGTLTTKGDIIFAGYSSLVAFSPSQFNSSIKPDRPTLTSIKLFDKFLFVDSLNTEEKRTFSHDQNSLTFSFSTLSFINQDKLKYFYRLSDIDPEWRSGGQSHLAVYSFLPPGRYTLEYRSENEEGISSPIGSFIFSITPPLHGTWWFRILLALVILGILILIYRLHINSIMAVVQVRNRVARDLHDDMGSTLSTINILSAMAKTKLHTDPVKTSDYISKISDNSQRMMEAMDDIVWSIKPQNDSMEKVISRMREFVTNALEAKDIDFRFEVEDEVYKVKLPMDARRDLFLVFKESVNNLAKYSKCSRAFIHFSIKKGQLHMRVRDYGMGFDMEALDSGNGLSNMKKRAENMGAKLKITSEKGEGTEVVMDVGYR